MILMFRQSLVGRKRSSASSSLLPLTFDESGRGVILALLLTSCLSLVACGGGDVDVTCPSLLQARTHSFGPDFLGCEEGLEGCKDYYATITKFEEAGLGDNPISGLVCSYDTLDDGGVTIVTSHRRLSSCQPNSEGWSKEFDEEFGDLFVCRSEDPAACIASCESQ